MSAQSILERFNSLGIDLVVDADSKLRVRPASRLNDELRALLRGNKSIIVEQIKAREILATKVSEDPEDPEDFKVSGPGVTVTPSGKQALAPCQVCRLALTPGIGNRYCGGPRPDLAPAYGRNHPARRLPPDLGRACAWFDSTP